MATRLNPYISFAGDARQAMEFYEQVFGGTLTLNTFGEFGGEQSDNIMHGMLESPNGYTIMGADNPPDQPHQPGNNYSVCLSGDDANELHGYWDKLADGAQITIPLEKQMWGDEFGMLIDKFGVAWMVNITG
jgi:PhnB protein